MLTICRMRRKSSIQIALAVAAAIGASLVAPACSSSSDDSPSDAGIVDVLFPQSCPTPIQIGAGDPSTNTYAGGACSTSFTNIACIYQAPCVSEDITIYTCTCDGSNWSCAITGDVEGGNCDAGILTDLDASASPEVDAALDASADASDADAF